MLLCVCDGGSGTVVIGEEEVTMNPSFKIFLTTRLPRPYFAPYICAMVMILHSATFSVCAFYYFGFLLSGHSSKLYNESISFGGKATRGINVDGKSPY